LIWVKPSNKKFVSLSIQNVIMKKCFNYVVIAIAMFFSGATYAQSSLAGIPGYKPDTATAYKQHNMLLNRARYRPKYAEKTTLLTGPVFDTTKWAHRVDSTWGYTYTTSEYLDIFNTWWNTINTQYPCFVHLPAYNWDSTVSAMQAEINAGVSEGRFAAICNKLLSMVNDGHTNFYDYTVNYPYTVYPGLPLLRGESGQFGACITTWNDTSAMVYDVYPEHPLGLQPGDIILGYNGVPWTQLLQIIFRNQLPNSVYKGSTDSATYHRYIQAAGENWYLFDTINILKCNGTIVNLPTSLMEGSLYQAFCTEQMAQPGIYKPNYNDYYNYHMDISYGVLAGTKIGYVYMYDCEDTTHKLYHAFKTLIEDSLVQGLILDIRTNFGGGFGTFVDAFEYLAAAGTSWVGYGQRSSSTNRLAMYIDGPTSWYNIYDEDPHYYPNPVAILCGPNAVSAGDFLPVMFKHIPNVKLFGKSTAGAFGNLTRITLPNYYFSGSMQQTNFFLVSDTTNYISHTMFPVDQRSWFNKDSVCNGSDNVVSTAVQWINNKLETQNIPDEKPSVFIYPNPTSGIISISINNLQDAPVSLEITNATGAVIYQNNFLSGKAQYVNFVDAGSWSAGIYFVKIKAKDNTSIQKLIKI